MFDQLIKAALKSALENPEIKERIKGKINNLEKNNPKTIDLDKNSYRVLE